MRDLAGVAALVPGAEALDGVLVVEPGKVLAAAEGIKKLGGFILFDLTCVDRPEGYEVAWRFMDTKERSSEVLTLRAILDRADPAVPSVMGIWKSADVLEREVWDLMGISFTGRGRLERILCTDDFTGHPLRKDFVMPKRSRFPMDEEVRKGQEGAR
ncbi:MAG: NADH-quinone oxidoreductase subunit C [Spirochaetota bacterium]